MEVGITEKTDRRTISKKVVRKETEETEKQSGSWQSRVADAGTQRGTQECVIQSPAALGLNLDTDALFHDLEQVTFVL